MAKIILPDIASQFASQEALNDRFNELSRQLNDNVLYRNNPVTEPNEMRNDLDMGLNDILNIKSLYIDGVDLAEAIRQPTAPDSEWGDGINNPVTSLRFKQMDGEWGEWEDLRGYIGLTGQDGAIGLTGPAGPAGEDSTVPGPQGNTGPAGADSTVPGPQGETGPAGATYDDTAIQAEVDLNTAKVSNVDHPLVETAVPTGALFTDTVYTLPFTDNSANWDTAYGWGDHSSTYLPLAGGTLTSGLTGTTASFTSYETTLGAKYQASDIVNNAGTKQYVSYTDGGSTVLHHNGSNILTTASAGINVTGNIAATGAFNAGTAVNLVNASTDASISARCATASYKLQAVGAHLTLLYLQDTAGVNGRIAILAKREGRVALYYNNVAKFETTDTGAKVTGVLEGTGAPTAAGHLTRKDYVDTAIAASAVVPVMLNCLYRAPLLIPGNAAHNGIHKVAYSSPSVGGTPSWFALSVDGYTITLSEDGIYELSHNTFIAATDGQRSSISAKFALGGVVQAVRPATGYIRLSGNHNESSTHIASYLVERSGSNLVLTVPLGNETSTGATNATMGAGESTLTIKKIT